MRISTLVAVVLLFGADACLAAKQKSVIEVETGGKTYSTDDEGYIDIPHVDAGPLRLRVLQKENIQFKMAGLSFTLPRGYSLEHDPTPPESWTFDGDDAMLTIYRNEPEDTETPMQFLAEMLRIGGHTCDPKPSTLHAAGRHFPGSACDVVSGEIRTRREVYLLATSNARWMLSFLLVRATDKPPSSEWADLKRVVSTTLTLEKP